MNWMNGWRTLMNPLVTRSVVLMLFMNSCKNRQQGLTVCSVEHIECEIEESEAVLVPRFLIISG